MRRSRIITVVIVVLSAAAILSAQTRDERVTYSVENTKHRDVKVIHLNTFVSPRSDQWKGGSNLSKFGRALNKTPELRDFRLSAREIMLVSTNREPSDQEWQFLISKVIAKFSVYKQIPLPVEEAADRTQSSHPLRQ